MNMQDYNRVLSRVHIRPQCRAELFAAAAAGNQPRKRRMFRTFDSMTPRLVSASLCLLLFLSAGILFSGLRRHGLTDPSSSLTESSTGSTAVQTVITSAEQTQTPLTMQKTESADGSSVADTTETAVTTGITDTTGTAEAADTTAASNDTGSTADADPEYDYEGTFKVSSYPWFNWVGEEPDFSEMKLELLVKNSDGKFSSAVLPFSFTVKSGLYSDYYTIDTSAVDSTKEGSYEVRILPKAGEIMTVSKDRDYRIKLTDHAASFTAQYHEKQTPLHFSSGNGRDDLVNCVLNEKCTVGLYNVNGSEIISCVINDPLIAEIVEGDDRKDYCNYKIRGLQTGETVITAETADGRTASCALEELFPDTTTDSTTVVSSGETTTIALSGDTEASAANTDFPQTGFSGVHKAVKGTAVLLMLTGVALVKKNRKEDEE